MGDVFPDRLQSSLRRLKAAKEAGPRVDVREDRQFVGFDAYKKVLATDIDIVLLTTPPAFRPLHYAAAIAAGKHVFMEKPVCVDGPGYRLVMETRKSRGNRRSTRRWSWRLAWPSTRSPALRPSSRTRKAITRSPCPVRPRRGDSVCAVPLRRELRIEPTQALRADR